MMVTGKKAASAAGTTLAKKGEPKKEKTAEASALSQAKKPPAKKAPAKSISKAGASR